MVYHGDPINVLYLYYHMWLVGYYLDYKGKGKVFYGQEPQSGESTTTECGVNYQLLAVMLLQ